MIFKHLFTFVNAALIFVIFLLIYFQFVMYKTYTFYCSLFHVSVYARDIVHARKLLVDLFGKRWFSKFKDLPYIVDFDS